MVPLLPLVHLKLGGHFMKNMGLILVLCVFSQTVFANTYVKCGKYREKKSDKIFGYELELSSESPDEYSGPAGRKWNIKLFKERSEWLDLSPNILAKNFKRDEKTVVEITMKYGDTPTGPVGLRYVLSDLYADYPTLEKFSFGGFAGTVKLGTYECITGND